MKTTTTILAIFFTLQTAFLFAGNENAISSTVENSTINVMTFAPVSPAEATFEEVIPVDMFLGWAPFTPAVASFEDSYVEMISLKDLSPVVPLVANFSEADDEVSVYTGRLSPVTPFEADFE